MIKNYLAAGYPCLYFQTHEQDRTIGKILSGNWSTHKIVVWDCIEGLKDPAGQSIDPTVTDPLSAITSLNGVTNTVLIAKNMHFFFESPGVKQALINGTRYWKGSQCCLVIVSPVLNLPVEIEKLIHVVEMGLPTESELLALQQDLLNGVKGNVEITIDQAAAKAAVGLTELEAETAFAKCLVEHAAFKVDEITYIKAQMIKKSGLMQIWEPEDLGSVGGLQALKHWLTSRARAWEPGNEYLPKIRGVLLVGVPGTGKSLVSKCAAKIFKRMLIRMNIADLKNSLVGESERQAREATKIVDAIGSSIVWWDEVEKALAGVKGAQHTGDTTTSMLGHFLNWMQESKADFIIMATANNIQSLPGEFIRRFDQVFFVDLPSRQEREEILAIMLRRYYPDAECAIQQNGMDIHQETIDRLNGYTGAEIEKVVRESLFDGWEKAMKQVIPISKTMKEDIDYLRDWAKTRAMLANTPESLAPVKPRTIQLRS